jgi:hypothetical protein
MPEIQCTHESGTLFRCEVNGEVLTEVRFEVFKAVKMTMLNILPPVSTSQ